MMTLPSMLHRARIAGKLLYEVVPRNLFIQQRHIHHERDRQVIVTPCIRVHAGSFQSALFIKIDLGSAQSYAEFFASYTSI